VTSTDSQPRRKNLTPPPSVSTDPFVRFLRTNRVIVAIYIFISHRLVPLLFAIFIVAPIGLVILIFFVPKFIRNAQRRRKYRVELLPYRIERVRGVISTEEAPLAERREK
jgi:hypothetical protein